MSTVVDALYTVLLRLYRALPKLLRRWVVRAIAPKFTVGAICFIERPDGALLFVRLAYREAWGAPGGLLKRGEAPADAAVREVREEVGLDIALVGQPAIVVDPVPQRIDVVYRARPLVHADLADVCPRGPEIVEAKWFPPDQLPELQFEAANALVELARSARSPQAVPLADASWFSRLPDNR
jgi:8-oxo-dGTP pyrophosphatase MutT (NUDIX family)